MSSSQLIQASQAFLDAFDTLDGDASIALRTPDCKHIFAPHSLNPPPPMDNDHFGRHLSALKGILDRFPVTPVEMHENPTKRQVTIWATGQATFKHSVRDDGLTAEQWVGKNEYMFILDFDEDGNKITRVFEFLDSKATGSLGELVARAKKNKGEESDLFAK